MRKLGWLLLVVMGVSCSQPTTKRDDAGRPVVAKPSGPPLGRQPMNFETPEWQTVEKLISEQKYEAARTELGKLRERAEHDGRAADWTRALIRDVQLGSALGGLETAVRTLRERPWPNESLSQLLLELYYAQTLFNYVQQYQYEINQRERLESKGPIDLKLWTREQIIDEALHAYRRAFEHRAELSESSTVLGAYLIRSTYPDKLRDTVRDALSYSVATVLADSAEWRPEETNELYRLDLGALLDGKVAPVAVDDRATHPLVRAVSILVDLRDWHVQRNERGAALEATLERLRHLHAAFSETRDRARLEAALARVLDEYRDVAWWAMGQSLLADWVRERGDLVLAHKLALDGEKAYPTSPGAIECRRIIGQIEQPDFSLATPLIDGANRRSLEITHKNLTKLYFRAYTQDLIARVEGAKDYNLLANADNAKQLVSGQTPVAAWTAELPATSDYRHHRTFVTPPMTKHGYYIVLVSPDANFAATQNRVIGAHFFVSSLVVRQRHETDGSIELTALDGDSGAPQPGVEMLFYEYNWQTGHQRADQKTTDKNGIAVISPPGLLSLSSSKNYFVIARREATHDYSPLTNGLWLGKPNKPTEIRSAFVFTDRSIYRPQQTVQWKILAYRGKGNDASWQSLTKEPIDVQLVDANGQQVATTKVKTNDYGTASGTFAIPTGRLLGQWHVRTSIGGNGAVRVEEYQRPTFEVKFLPAKDALTLNAAATVKGEAKYYFGLPVTGGNVKWKVSREEVYPWWWWWYRAPTSAQVIATGTAAVDDKGQFDVKFTPEAKAPAADDKRARAVRFRYEVSADLTDEGGETRSANRGFSLGWVSIDARLDLDRGFFLENQPGELALSRTNLDGDPRAGAGTWKLYDVTQPAKTPLPIDAMPRELDENVTVAHDTTPGDKLQPRTANSYVVEQHLAAMPDGKERAHGDVTTAADGTAKLALPALPAGAYRVRYESLDDHGQTLEVFRDFLVGGKHMPLAVPAILRIEKSALEVGDKARLLVHSGLVDQPLWLEVSQAGHLIERRALDGKSDRLQEFAITKEHRGGLAFRLVGLRDYQELAGGTSAYVPWSDRALTVEFSTFRDTLRPGAKETFKVTVKSALPSDKAPVVVQAAEVLAYMYDRSLDVFAPHSPPSPSSLYPGRAYGGNTAMNLQASPSLWVYNDHWAEVPGGIAYSADRLDWLEGYPIGGMGYRNRMYFRGGSGGGPGGVYPVSPPSTAPPAPPPPPQAQGAPRPEPVERSKAASTPKPDLVANAMTILPNATPNAPAPQVRTNFSETAFFAPSLLTDKDGSASVEFTVPDSVTSWNVWVHALTRDLRSGSLTKETRTIKDLLIRPYLPRFLREADEVEIKVVVQNAGKTELKGELVFELLDPQTQKSVAADFGLRDADAKKPFTVAVGGSTNLTFALKAPRRVGEVVLRVVGQAGTFSDGERRALPLLPSRLHLVQSKFATLRENATRTLELKDLEHDDDKTRTNEQLVVTVDAQLFMTVLKALPFLVDYPYECSEQTLNRFLSAGIVSSVFTKYPAVKTMAADLVKQRTTLLDKFDAPDPNRTTLLEESPWLVDAKGGDASGLGEKLIKVLDPEVAKHERDRALDRLRKMQTSSGGFPWFPGGPPSPYMTLYLLIGFARASEFHVDVPKDMVTRAWQYVATHYRNDILRELKEEKASPEFIALIHFGTTSYPDASWIGGAFTDAERQEMLAYVFARWKKLQPLIKCVLTLSLLREKRGDDAKLVFASVMDSAKTTEDEGTFWQPEDRAWLWYNDRIETHAFALRTLLEINQNDPKLEGLVVWLLLNKKLNQWKSTRATAEVIYSLVKYLDQKNAMGGNEDVALQIGALTENLHFAPDKYEGKKQVRVDGKDVTPQMGKIVAKKTGKGIAFASATWHYATDQLPTEGRGDLFHVTRTYYRRDGMGKEKKLVPLAEGTKLVAGDEIEVELAITSRAQAEYVQLRDPRAAGLEPPITVSGYKYDLGLVYYQEVRDSATSFFIEWLPAGEYTLKYRLRAAQAGRFRVGPATLQSMYAPEFAAFSAGNTISVDGGK